MGGPVQGPSMGVWGLKALSQGTVTLQLQGYKSVSLAYNLAYKSAPFHPGHWPCSPVTVENYFALHPSWRASPASLVCMLAAVGCAPRGREAAGLSIMEADHRRGEATHLPHYPRRRMKARPECQMTPVPGLSDSTRLEASYYSRHLLQMSPTYS